MAKALRPAFELWMSAIVEADRTIPADELAAMANDGDHLGIYWAEKIYKGITKADFAEVEALVRNVQRRSHPRLDRSGQKFYWETEASTFRPNISRETGMALIVMRLANDGYLDKLRRCALKDCQKWFFPRRSDAQWCSASCGSKARVRKFRRSKQ